MLQWLLGSNHWGNVVPFRRIWQSACSAFQILSCDRHLTMGSLVAVVQPLQFEPFVIRLSMPDVWELLPMCSTPPVFWKLLLGFVRQNTFRMQCLHITFDDVIGLCFSQGSCRKHPTVGGWGRRESVGSSKYFMGVHWAPAKLSRLNAPAQRYSHVLSKFSPRWGPLMTAVIHPVFLFLWGHSGAPQSGGLVRGIWHGYAPFNASTHSPVGTRRCMRHTKYHIFWCDFHWQV